MRPLIYGDDLLIHLVGSAIYCFGKLFLLAINDEERCFEGWWLFLFLLFLGFIFRFL